MILGIKVELVEEALHQKGGTYPEDLRMLLKASGYQPGPRNRQLLPGIPSIEMGVLRVRWKNDRGGHWIVLNGDQVLDPSCSAAMTREGYEGRLQLLEARVTEYFEIRKVEEKAEEQPKNTYAA